MIWWHSSGLNRERMILMFEEFAPEWEGFSPGRWTRSVNVREFIHKNITPYDGDESFLTGATPATEALWAKVTELAKQEHEKGGVLDMDTDIVSTITSHGAGYLDKNLEKIVGLQTDKPFKRALQPFGGIRMAQQACREYGYEVDPKIVEIFTKYRKTHKTLSEYSFTDYPANPCKPLYNYFYFPNPD